MAVLARVNAAARAHPGRLLPPVRLARRLSPRARFLAETEALLTARARGFAAAAPLFAEIAARPLAGAPAAAALLRPASPGPVRLAVPLGRARASSPRPTPRARSSYRRLRPAAGAAPVAGLAERVRFLCFTDRLTDGRRRPRLDDAAAGGRKPRPGRRPGSRHGLPQDPGGGGARRAAPVARASLWLDPDRQLVGNLDTLLARWLLPQDIALWRHADSDWRAMAERHLVAGTAPAAAVIAQAERFAAARVPGDRGGCDTGMVWRRHDAPGVAALCDAWWESWQAAPGADDLALYRAARRGTRRSSGRRSCPPGSGRPPTTSSSPASPGGAAPPRAAPPARPLPVVFLGAARFANFASTFLRGRQLSAMVAAAFPDYDVRFTEDADACGTRWWC